jgi:hypothetical protein
MKVLSAVARGVVEGVKETFISLFVTRSRGYINKTHLRRFQNFDFGLVRVGGLRLYSRAGRG